jgi:hypothetical protein
MWTGSGLAGETMSTNAIRVVLGVVLVVFGARAIAQEEPTTKTSIYVNHKGLLKLGWQLAAVGSAFQDRSMPDMVDLLHSLNVHHIQLSAEQVKNLDDAAAAAAFVAKLKSVKMDVVSMGPIELGVDEASARPSFELAKKFKMKTIVTDAEDSSLEMLDKLANEYKVNVAIENQAKPGGHWNPDDLAKALEGRSNRIGVYADVAAWRASGVAPADAVNKVAGHVLVIRLTKFDDFDSALTLGELNKQKFKGICAVEAPAGSDVVEKFAAEVTEFSKIVGGLSGVE